MRRSSAGAPPAHSYSVGVGSVMSPNLPVERVAAIGRSGEGPHHGMGIGAVLFGPRASYADRFEETVHGKRALRRRRCDRRAGLDDAARWAGRFRQSALARVHWTELRGGARLGVEGDDRGRRPPWRPRLLRFVAGGWRAGGDRSAYATVRWDAPVVSSALQSGAGHIGSDRQLVLVRVANRNREAEAHGGGARRREAGARDGGEGPSAAGDPRGRVRGRGSRPPRVPLLHHADQRLWDALQPG